MEQSEQHAESALIRAAFGHFQAGRTVEAADGFRRVLAIHPDHLDALLMLGLILSDGSQAEAAQADILFQRGLALSPGNVFILNQLGQSHQRRGEHQAAVALFERAVAADPTFAPAYNNMGVSLHQLGRRPAALAALDQALAQDGGLVAAHGNRGQVLADRGQWDEAHAAFTQVVTHLPDHAQAWRGLAASCLHTNRLDEAQAACARAMTLDPDDIEAMITLAGVHERAGRAADAQRMFGEVARRRPVIIEPCRVDPPAARVLILSARGGANVPTRFLFDRKRFTTIALNLPPPGEDDGGLDAVIAGLPPFDLVFSAVGDGRADDPVLAQVAGLARRLGRPLLNPPDTIPPTCRDALPTLLADIPNVLVPATRRVTRAELELAAHSGLVERAVLIRPIGSHGGHDLSKIETAADLAAYLEHAPFEEFFSTPYVDYVGGDGFYRKYRFIFVDRQAYPLHLAIHDDWLIHYFRTDMAQQTWMMAEEEAFLADPHSAFPGPLTGAVAAIARRLDLDYGGMDCAVTPDGRILVFEANACMLLHLDDSPELFPYKHRYVPRIVQAIGAMVVARSGRAG